LSAFATGIMLRYPDIEMAKKEWGCNDKYLGELNMSRHFQNKKY
jgi:hypothetical protein